MKALLIGSEFEGLFNQNLDVDVFRKKLLSNIENFDNQTINKFLTNFFQEVTFFEEKETLLIKNSELIFKKLISPVLMSQSLNASFEYYLNQISWNIEPFLKEHIIGLGPNVIESFIKNLFLFYWQQQWKLLTKPKIEKFLKLSTTQKFFSQYDVLLSTSFSPILELINQFNEFKLNHNSLINFYGKLNDEPTTNFNNISLFWKGNHENTSNFLEPLKALQINQLDIVKLNLNNDPKLFEQLLKILKANPATPSEVNYLTNNQTSQKQFYNFLKNHQLNEITKQQEYEEFKQKEKNLTLTVLKNQKLEVANYGYKILYDNFDSKTVSLNRKHATIIQSEFYYNLNKFFEDGYTIENDDFLLKTKNEFIDQEDLIINFLDFENNFGGIYNNIFQEYFNFKNSQVETIEKQNLIVAKEVRPKVKKSFWSNLFNKNISN